MAKKQFTIPQLKKRLAELEQQELIQLLAALYKTDAVAERIINQELLGEVYQAELTSSYKEAILECFFPTNIRKGFSAAKAKVLLMEFKKISNSPAGLVDVLLYYVECGTDFTNSFGDMEQSFYNDLVRAYSQAADIVANEETEDLYQTFADRFEGIMVKALDIGWGYGAAISEEFFDIPWYSGLD